MARTIVLRQQRDGAWRSEPDGEVEGPREECLRRLEEMHPDDRVAVELRPALVGVAEAAAILGWDKRRVSTYVRRGSFPQPMAVLAGGRVWALDDVAAFAESYRARRAT